VFQGDLGYVEKEFHLDISIGHGKEIIGETTRIYNIFEPQHQVCTI
jgi:hypothetical protein